MIYVFLADGFEECEALIPIDILLRAGFNVKTVGVTSKNVKSSHGIEITADITEKEVTTDNLECIILPGGMPGTINLEKSKMVQDIVHYAFSKDIIIAAICAAPSILGHKGLLKNKNATCYDGFEQTLIDANFTGKSVEIADNIITACGVGAAFPFGFAVLSKLKGENFTDKIKKQMKY